MSFIINFKCQVSYIAFGEYSKIKLNNKLHKTKFYKNQKTRIFKPRINSGFAI